MYFQDEYEYVTNSGVMYYVEVEGEQHNEEGYITNHFNTITISDEDGAIDNTHDDFSEVYEDALEREYEVCEENRNFEQSDGDIDNFLKEKNYF